MSAIVESGEATTEQIRLIGKRQLAAVQDDQEQVTILTVALKQAGGARDKVQEAVRQHERFVHSVAKG